MSLEIQIASGATAHSGADKCNSLSERQERVRFGHERITVKRQTPIYEAIGIMVENNITGLPVANDDMTLADIISEKDVLEL